ncbi:toll/interleukin-1 receptor domain-containing protein [Neisseria perflava]|uniref:toll/interleukin-1 receptor domain-containing protein n=1 Tax=Neisseria perflava TaxID=33053 RepID=UPI00345F79C3
MSYSHQDESYKKELETHLASLRHRGIIEVWNDRRISAGEEWKDEIDNNLKNSDLILFLISSDFLASDYCMDKEALQAMKQHEEGTSTLIPIIIRQVRWQQEELNKFQALPKDAKAVSSSSWSSSDEAWCNVVEGIETVLETIKKRKPNYK